MTVQHVYIIDGTLEANRPKIDSESSEQSVDWFSIMDMLDGTIEIGEYEPPRLVAPFPDATEWDYFPLPGTLGVWSEKMLQALGPYAKGCLRFLEAYINDSPYFMPCKFGMIDCLDRERTLGEVFPHDPSRYMEIEQYAFHKSRLTDPCVFIIPEGNSSVLFGTDSISQLISQSKLRGIRAVDAEQDHLRETLYPGLFGNPDKPE